MELSTRTRRAAATLLAVALGVGSVSVVAGAATPAVTHPLPVDPPAGQVLAAEAPVATVDVANPAPAARFIVVAPRPLVAAIPAADLVQAAELAEANARAEAAAKRAAERAERQAEREAERRAEARREAKAAREAARREAARREARAAAADEDNDKGGGKDKDTSPNYRGRNHVWIPALGISRSVEWFPCSREREPDNYMYRWGCAGDNNVYLMGHAYSVMKPLHDAYVNDRLNKGMKVWYADNNSRVRVYAVRWWKVTKPTTDAAWAWAPQDVPSMTLQTCVGRNSQYRLMVRLTEVD